MKTEETALVVSETTDVATRNDAQNLGLMSLDLSQPIPDLSTAEVFPLDLMSDYWTPEVPGENKRVIFVGLSESPVMDINSPEVVHMLPCAFFLERTEKGEVRKIRNGSKRLVASLENVPLNCPLLITYLGKKQNRTNSFKSDNWSLKPLKLNIG